MFHWELSISVPTTWLFIGNRPANKARIFCFKWVLILLNMIKNNYPTNVEQFATAIEKGKYQLTQHDDHIELSFKDINGICGIDELLPYAEKVAQCWLVPMCIFPVLSEGKPHCVFFYEKSRVKSESGRVFELALRNEDFTYSDLGNNTLEVVFKGQKFVDAICNCNKSDLMIEITPVVNFWFDCDLVGDSIDQMTPDEPIVSALFTAK